MKIEISIQEMEKIEKKLDEMFEMAFKQGYLTKGGEDERD